MNRDATPRTPRYRRAGDVAGKQNDTNAASAVGAGAPRSVKRLGNMAWCAYLSTGMHRHGVTRGLNATPLARRRTRLFPPENAACLKTDA